MSITDAQLRFFEVFGYLLLPRLLEQEIGWISDEFARVWATAPRNDIRIIDGKTSDAVVPFIDQSPRLCTLVDHPRLEPALERILGPDYNYLSSDGRPYAGDTAWHSDGHRAGPTLFIKVAFYLDPLTRDTGALRVIPGTQRLPDGFANAAREAKASDHALGMPMRDVPSVALETRPGDVVIFNHTIMHASFGGDSYRRMFTMNLSGHAATPEQEQELRDYLGNHIPRWSERTHGDIMRTTATPSRMRHLAQVMANEGHLPGLRRRMAVEAEAKRAASALAMPSAQGR